MTQTHIRPSWQNRLIDWLRSASVPAAVLYGLIFLIASLLLHISPWLEGKLPWGRLDPNQFNFLVWYLFILPSFGYILDHAEKAVVRFRPLVDVSDEEYEVLSRRFTTIPAAIGWTATAISLVFSVLAYQIMFPWEYSQSGASQVVTTLVSTFLLSFAFTLIYLMFNQEVMISRLYAHVKGINIFELSTLYVFSGMTSRISIFAILAGILAYLTNVVFASGEPQLQNFLIFGTTFFSLALASFFLPSLGIHARLEEEKARARKENDERINRVFIGLHEHVDGTRTSGLDELQDQLSVLLMFRTEIAKVSTWPWDPGTLRAFLSTLLLPILVGVIQSLLSKFVEF